MQLPGWAIALFLLVDLAFICYVLSKVFGADRVCPRCCTGEESCHSA